MQIANWIPVLLQFLKAITEDQKLSFSSRMIQTTSKLFKQQLGWMCSLWLKNGTSAYENTKLKVQNMMRSFAAFTSSNELIFVKHIQCNMQWSLSATRNIFPHPCNESSSVRIYTWHHCPKRSVNPCEDHPDRYSVPYLSRHASILIHSRILADGGKRIGIESKRG